MADLSSNGEIEKRILRAGIIGSGAMGLEHIRNISLIDGMIVTAVADTDERARQEAKDLLPGGSVAFVVDYRDMIVMDSVDILIVATPNNTHIDLFRNIIASGKHILAEKPMCTTVEDCLETECLVKQHMPPGSGLVFWVGMEYRFMPPISGLLEHVDTGKIGRPIMVHIREHRFPFLVKVGDWNRFSAATGGTLVEKCCHFWDLMLRIISRGDKNFELDPDAVKVFATGDISVNHINEGYERDGVQVKPDIIDNAYVAVDFGNGMRGCLDLCMFAEERQREEILVVGDKGKVTATAPDCTLTLHTPQETQPSRVPPPPGQYESNTVSEVTHVPEALLDAGFHEGATYFELTAFTKAIRDSALPTVDAHDGTAAVALGVAAERSIREGRLVILNEVYESIKSGITPLEPMALVSQKTDTTREA
mmetsp:Transcript_58774/g.80178  ORF Transcript_58774/g.80178 Transcript_58774/m.80178 type:complete len:423 (-) Transcript_58774:86-1354(-)|eukprot:CAMPEP_0185774604 /NCGR_PEP_ID=MMETSP1174-20130828/79008_1 /TAXON_ID=35687 /ORGANISM="Dictyocha speculum, Strain CCMP1381" /LENGTH=422 /DNA_ID=CAMNT_0028461859 /DNA_START=100 /DNA_END=1368 /DNA_ORIENTATION=+